MSLARMVVILLNYVTVLSACRRPFPGQACSLLTAQAIYPTQPRKTVSARHNGLCHTSEMVHCLRMGLFVKESRLRLSWLRYSYDQPAGFYQCWCADFSEDFLATPTTFVTTFIHALFLADARDKLLDK